MDEIAAAYGAKRPSGLRTAAHRKHRRLALSAAKPNEQPTQAVRTGCWAWQPSAVQIGNPANLSPRAYGAGLFESPPRCSSAPRGKVPAVTCVSPCRYANQNPGFSFPRSAWECLARAAYAAGVRVPRLELGRALLLAGATDINPTPNPLGADEHRDHLAH